MLRSLGPNLVFRQPDKAEKADWWLIPLIDWENYNGKYSKILIALQFGND